MRPGLFSLLTMNVLRHLAVVGLFGACLSPVSMMAQAPGNAQGMSYQALLRDADGAPLANEGGTLGVSVLNAADSLLWSQQLPVTTDAFGLIMVRIGGGALWEGLPWHQALQMSATWTGTDGPVDLGTQWLGEVPKAQYAGNGWFYQGQEDLRLSLESDTVRLHADSLIVVGNTREGDTLLTEVIRLQAQRDVILSGRDDVSAFANDDIKMIATSDVRLESGDDVRLESLDDIRANAANELELVGTRRTNLGTKEGVLPAADTTVVMARQFLHIGAPVGIPLTGTPQDTLYLPELLRLAGQSIAVEGPAQFNQPIAGVDAVNPDELVTLAQLQGLMIQMQQWVASWALLPDSVVSAAPVPMPASK